MLPIDVPCKHDECGCEVSKCCFNCPLPVCKDELPQGMRSVRTYMKDLRIVHLLDEGYTVERVVRLLRVGERTVYRAMERSKNTVTSRLTDTNRRATMTIAAPTKSSNGRGHDAR